MKKIKLVRLSIAMTGLIFCDLSYSIGNGFYLGLMLGPSNNTTSMQQAQNADCTQSICLIPAYPRTQQFATRLFFGNQFSPYAAFELGFDFFSKIKFDTKGKDALGGTPSIRPRAVDIDIVGILPFYFLSVFAKAGAAYTYVTTAGLNPVYQPNNVKRPVTVANTTQNKIAPTFGLGATFDINQSWVINFAYTVIQLGGNLGSVSSLTLGFSYHFTDKYCGQFLCDD